MGAVQTLRPPTFPGIVLQTDCDPLVSCQECESLRRAGCMRRLSPPLVWNETLQAPPATPSER